MIFLIKFFNTLLPILYLALVYLYGLYFFRTPRWILPHMANLLKLTVGVHLLEVVLRGFYFQHFPLADVFEVLTVLALAITLIYTYVEYRIKIKTTGFFILIVSFLLQLISSAFIDFAHAIPEVLKSVMFVFHTSAVLVSYAALFVAALYSLMYLLLFYKIKNAQFGIIYGRLPSLEELSEMNIRAVILGFLGLSAAIFLGIMWRKTAYPDSPHFDPKVIISYLVWVIYGLVIYGNKIRKWAGKQLAYLSVSGFLLILFSMIVVNLFLETFHRFQ